MVPVSGAVILVMAALFVLPGGRGWAQGGRVGTARGGQTQTDGSSGGLLPAGETVASVEVTGRVLDVRTRQPVARALVQFGARRVLTDHEGVFRLPEVTSAAGSFRVTKPGYFADNEAAGLGVYRFPSAAPIELMLSPEAVLTGTATDTTGEVVPHLAVVARGSNYNETGHHWSYAGQTQTLSDGTYRMSVPAGVYAVQALATGRPLAGAEALQSLSIPANPLALNEAIRLEPGEERHLDLRPAMRRTYDVTLHVEGGPDRGFPLLTARPASGPSIILGTVLGREEPGTFHAGLANGTYEIVADLQSREGRQQGRTRVTVAGHDVTGVKMVLTPVPVFPVVVEVESGAASDNAVPAPSALQLGLTMAALPTAADLNDAIFSPNGGPGRGGAGSGPPSFALPEGSYRFHARAEGAWYVTAASCGGTDLLQQNLALSGGASGAEVRVRVSNRTGDLTGVTQLDGAGAAAWVYLVATTPSATPIVLFRSGSMGNFTRPYVAPGTYRAVAMERQASIDLRNPEVLNRLGGRVQTLTVNPGDHATLTLAAVPAGEVGP